MRIKRFHSPDMRQAMSKIRGQLGPEAVILSHQRVDGGVEITAATDCDDTWLEQFSGQGSKRAPESPAVRKAQRETPPFERELSRRGGHGHVEEVSTLDAMGQELKSLRGLLEHQLTGMAWTQLGQHRPVHAGILKQLLELGLSRRISRGIVERLPDRLAPHVGWRTALAELAHRVEVTSDSILTDGGALFGPTGVGKTTTIAKLAARFALRHGMRSVALVTTDSYRVGAHEQLRTFGRILDIPVRVVRDQESLSRSLDAFSDRRLVLIDTAGMSQRDTRFPSQVALVKGASPLVKSYLVVSATTQMPGLEEAVRGFHNALPRNGGAGQGDSAGGRPDGCVITKIDEATSLGGVVSVIVRHGIPVAYLSNGQRVPEDISPARAHSLVVQMVTVAEQTGRDLVEDPLDFTFARKTPHASR